MTRPARRPVRVFLAAVLVTGHMTLIFVLSSDRPPGSIRSLSLPDYVLHLVEYAVLGALLANLALSVSGRRSAGALILLPALIGTLYGLSDEWHQSFIPSRDASGADLAMDAIGSLLGAAAFRLLLALRRG